MNIQNYLLCILYIVLIVVHSYTLFQKDFHRGLVSIFSFALLTETVSTVLEALYQLDQETKLLGVIGLSSSPNFHYIAQLIHITAINFFILFLLIIAKGWPITRSDMPFKYAFAIFWLLCLAADLITFYWTTITAIARNFSNIDMAVSLGSNLENGLSGSSNATTVTPNGGGGGGLDKPVTNLSTTIIENLPKEQEQFNSTPRRLSLLLRVIIMIYFLLELRTTMILEQEKKKLQFYLNFGALTMVWFVHTLIVYIISLRVDSNWQTKLVSGFSSVANFLGFAVTTRLMWPKNSQSDLFRKSKRPASDTAVEDGCELDNFSTLDRDEVADLQEEYDGLQMRDLSNNSNNKRQQKR